VERLTNLLANTREKTFVSYLTEINSIEREPAESTIPNRMDVTNSGAAIETEKCMGEQRQPATQEENNDSPFFHILPKRPALQRDLDDEHGAGPKRQRLAQSDMPWHGVETGRVRINHISKPNMFVYCIVNLCFVKLKNLLTKYCKVLQSKGKVLSTMQYMNMTCLLMQLVSCNRTCELLELYGEDLVRSKFLIRTARNSPEGIQASQWEQILRGESLNLDHILSSLVRTHIDEDRKACIGETHLSFSTSEAKRKVRNAADWATAW